MTNLSKFYNHVTGSILVLRFMKRNRKPLTFTLTVQRKQPVLDIHLSKSHLSPVIKEKDGALLVVHGNGANVALACEIHTNTQKHP